VSFALIVEAIAPLLGAGSGAAPSTTAPSTNEGETA